MGDLTNNPIVQCGFAGMCAVLLGIIVWLIKQLLTVLKETNTVIGENTKTIGMLHTTSNEEIVVLRDIQAKLMARPCLMKGEQ